MYTIWMIWIAFLIGFWGASFYDMTESNLWKVLIGIIIIVAYALLIFLGETGA